MQVAFRAPYKLERGGVFDVECRNGKTGDGAFLAVTKLAQGKSLEELPSSFFLDCLFDTTGRFSFYGPPMDVKVKKSQLIDNDRRVIELTSPICLRAPMRRYHAMQCWLQLFPKEQKTQQCWWPVPIPVFGGRGVPGEGREISSTPFEPCRRQRQT